MDYFEEEKVINFCEENDIDIEDLDEDVAEAIFNDEEVNICEKCGMAILPRDTYTCDSCQKDLCEVCFGDPAEETECFSCMSDDNYN